MEKKVKKVNKLYNLPPCTKEDVYKLWLTFLTPLHKLTPRNIEIAAELLKKREELSKVILDESILMRMLMSTETRDEITKKCNISTTNYHVALNSLKKHGFIKDDKINPKMIPMFDGSNTFSTMLVFTLKDE